MDSPGVDRRGLRFAVEQQHDVGMEEHEHYDFYDIVNSECSTFYDNPQTFSSKDMLFPIPQVLQISMGTSPDIVDYSQNKADATDDDSSDVIDEYKKTKKQHKPKHIFMITPLESPAESLDGDNDNKVYVGAIEMSPAASKKSSKEGSKVSSKQASRVSSKRGPKVSSKTASKKSSSKGPSKVASREEPSMKPSSQRHSPPVKESPSHKPPSKSPEPENNDWSPPSLSDDGDDDGDDQARRNKEKSIRAWTEQQSKQQQSAPHSRRTSFSEEVIEHEYDQVDVASSTSTLLNMNFWAFTGIVGMGLLFITILLVNYRTWGPHVFEKSTATNNAAYPHSELDAALEAQLNQMIEPGQVTDAFMISNMGELQAVTSGVPPLTQSDTHKLLRLLRAEPGKHHRAEFMDMTFTFSRCPRYQVLVGKSRDVVVLGLRGNSSTLVAFTDTQSALPAVEALRRVAKQMACHLRHTARQAQHGKQPTAA